MEITADDFDLSDNEFYDKPQYKTLESKIAYLVKRYNIGEEAAKAIIETHSRRKND